MQLIRKIASGAIGLLMTGASLMGAALAVNDLSTLATDFQANNTLVVVGADAKTSDVVGAINIAAKVAQHGATGGAAATVAGASTEEIPLENTLGATFGTLKDNDISVLKDTKVTWADEEVDVEETITVADVKVEASDTDKDFGENVFLGTDASSDSIVYSYDIDDDDFNYSAVSDDDELSIELLGKDIVITEVSNGTTDRITVQEATEVALKTGESVTVSGKTVTATAIGESTAAFSIGTDTEFINDGDTEEIGDTGIEVTVKDILYTTEVESRQVLVLVGTDVEDTVSDGESMELFGEPEEESKAKWLWSIDASDTDTGSLTIGATHNQKLDSDTEAVVAVGGAISLPNNYVKISFNKLTADADVTYTFSFVEDLKVDLDESGDDLSDHEGDALKIESTASDGIEVSVSGETEETDIVYLFISPDTGNLSAAYVNNDGDVQIFANGTTEDFYLVNDETSITITYTNETDGGVTVTLSDEDTADIVETDVVIASNVTGQKLGATQEEAEAADLTRGGTEIGSNEDSIRTQYGAVIETPEDNADADEVVIRLPPEQVNAEITIAAGAVTVATATAAAVVPLPTAEGIAKLDSAVSDADKTNKNLIVVGSPAVNRIAAQLFSVDYPTYGYQWAAKNVTIAEDGYLIKLYANAFATGKLALLVAGWEAADTTEAALKVMQSGLTGTSVTG